MRSILLAVLGVALLAACGGTASAGTAAQGSPSPRASGAGRGAGAAAVGKLAEINDTNLVVTTQTGRAAILYSQSTVVLRGDAGTQADIAPGTCVTAGGQGDVATGITATTFQVMLNMNGNCALPTGAGGAAGRPSPRPSGAGTGGAAGGAFVRGKVASVSGSTVVVQPNTGSPVNVTVTGSTRIVRLQTASTSDLSIGQCLVATGPRDASGAVQARQLTITQPSAAGSCTAAGLGGGFGGGGGPRPTSGA